MKNDSFTDVIALMTGKKSSGPKKNTIDIIQEDGSVCGSHGIPDVTESMGDRGVTVIEDHTLVQCGGSKNNGQSKSI